MYSEYDGGGPNLTPAVQGLTDIVHRPCIQNTTEVGQTSPPPVEPKLYVHLCSAFSLQSVPQSVQPCHPATRFTSIR
jgi:hypothetical protein